MWSFVNAQRPTETNCRDTWIVYTSVLQVGTFLVNLTILRKGVQRFCKVKLSWLWHLLTQFFNSETHHGYRDTPWLQRLTMVTETHRGYRDSPWLQRLTIVTETHHSYRDSPWLQRLTMVTETHHGYRDLQWCRVWASELTSTAVVVFSMWYRHYIMSGICTLIEMRCIFYELKQL